MEVESHSAPDPAIYESLEALDAYLNQVRIRREERRRTKLAAERLCAAIAKVTAEWEAAQQDGDAEIVLELQAVLAEFERRLEAIRPGWSQQAGHGARPMLASDAVAPQPPATVTALPAPDTAPVGLILPRSLPPVSATIEAPAGQHEPSPQEARSPSDALMAAPAADASYIALSAEERDALLQTCLNEVDTLAARWDELDQTGLRGKDKVLDRPACLQLRALACSLAVVQTRAEDAGLHSQIVSRVTTLRDRMELARAYAGDISDTPPFDASLWTRGDERLPADAWEWLAYRYAQAGAAQEAWDWYVSTREDHGGSGHYNLLNSIGAIQQMLFRDLEHYGCSDRLQGDLYGSLREAAGSVGFLTSLNAGTTYEELEALGGALPGLFEQARRDLVVAREKRDKETRKATALAAVLQWQQQNSAQPLAADSVTRARGQLLPLLDECLSAGIPATNIQVRGALLHVAPLLLQDLPKYSKFLEAVLAERKRKGLDAILTAEAEPSEEEDLPDSQILGTVEWVRMLTEGQKVLILGGSSRQQVADRLRQTLNCVEAQWLDSKKGDRMNKFKMDIARADIVIVVKKFASHEMTEKGRDWAKEYGKLFVLLPGGYGVNQIIHQMYLQLVPQDVNKRADASPLKPGTSSFANLNLISN